MQFQQCLRITPCGINTNMLSKAVTDCFDNYIIICVTNYLKLLRKHNDALPVFTRT